MILFSSHFSVTPEILGKITKKLKMVEREMIRRKKNRNDHKKRRS